MWGQVEHLLTIADLEKFTSLFTIRPGTYCLFSVWYKLLWLMGTVVSFKQSKIEKEKCTSLMQCAPENKSSLLFPNTFIVINNLIFWSTETNKIKLLKEKKKQIIPLLSTNNRNYMTKAKREYNSIRNWILLKIVQSISYFAYLARTNAPSIF